MNDQVRMWKDPEYRAQQSPNDMAHPAGMTELSDDALDAAGGMAVMQSESLLTWGCCWTFVFTCMSWDV